MLNLKNNQKGFAAFYIAVLTMIAVFGLVSSISILTYREQKIADNIIKSSQSYYVAEAGVEDALLRLAKGSSWSSPYALNVGGGRATTTISAVVGGSRTITAEGGVLNRARKIQVVYQVTAQAISFYYGAQVGDGGLLMDDNSKVIGNIFSNATARGSLNSEITGTVWVANNGNKIMGLNIGGDAYAHTCDNSIIGGTLTYVSGGSVVGCTASSSIKERPGEISPKELPISQTQIDTWKSEALAGGIISGDFLLSANQFFLGPKKIVGKMTIDGDAHLFITGPVWVTGDIVVQNNAQVSLDPNSYGSLSGAIIGDGLITLQNNSISFGSGQPGSYLMYLSTAPSNPAVIVKNNAVLDIVFTSNGWIEIQNNVIIREVTGHGIHLKNNVEIEYETGLEDSSFSSGPGGSWTVTDWKEVE